jgi:hypothetical protein
MQSLSLSRRALLGLGGVLVFATQTDSARALARLVASRGAGIGRTIDANRDGAVTIELRRAGSPTKERRGSAVLMTSNGEPTGDYAVSLVTLVNEGSTLGDLADGEFGYDFYTGDRNDSASPDEVWIVLRSQESGPSRFHPVFRTEDLGSTEAWEHRDVAREIAGNVPADGTNQEWKAFDLQNYGVDRIGQNLLEQFDRDAAVEAVGVGRGTPSMDPSVIETYYDAFVVDGTERRLPVGHGPPVDYAL